MITIPLSTQGKHAGKYEAIVDDIDADLAELRWSVQVKQESTIYYARGYFEPNTKRQYFMHRVILARILGRPLQKKEQVDHISADGLDNRRVNLRVASNSQNGMNRGPQSNNTSGYKGVDFRKQTQKWIAQININKKRIYLGTFNTAEEAHAAYCEAAKEYHGEFANEG